MVILLAVALVVVLAALPRWAPPHLERLAVSKLASFGVNARARVSLRYGWQRGPCLSGAADVSVPGTPWLVHATLLANCGGCSVGVTMPQTNFSESDPLIRRLLDEKPPKGVTNLTFSGSVALEAKGDWRLRKPVPVWSAKAPLRDVSARIATTAQTIELAGLSVTPGASGLADHVDVSPMFLRTQALMIGAFALTNVVATIRATERALVISEARAGFGGGQASVYSLYLDPASLNAGFTLFFDDVDAGRVLSHVSGFRGTASGRLHGKLRAAVIAGGKAIRLRESFLYSVPGETGKLRMTNPEALSENLAYAGLDSATQANVANALTDLDYQVLRLDLRRTDDQSARLSVRISGTATRGSLTVPVNLTINLNGEIEQLVNTGLGYSAKLKGKKK